MALDAVLDPIKGGNRETYTFDASSVSVAWVASRDGNGTGTGGLWPNLGTCRFNEPFPVPEPAGGTIANVNWMG